MNRNQSPRRALTAAFMALALGTSAAHSQGLFKPDLVQLGNRWTITFFNDAAPGHDQWATQGICFRYAGIVGTHQRYIWWSDTYPDWNGRATQEGDEIVMHGDYAKDVGHDGMKWEITASSPKNEGGGHWWEWREDGGYGSTIGFGNARLQRVGSCRTKFEDSHLIPLPLDADGREMESPMGNIKEAEMQPEIK